MDPLTAFSLACGIIQVVDFGSRAVKTCRELHKDGSSSANEDLEEMAKHLTGLRTRLSLPDPGQHNQDELLDLGSKCSDTTQALMTELQKLKVNDRHKKRQVFGKTIKTLWKKGAIDEIEKRLDRYREILDTRVLLDLRFVYCWRLISLHLYLLYQSFLFLRPHIVIGTRLIFISC